MPAMSTHINKIILINIFIEISNIWYVTGNMPQMIMPDMLTNLNKVLPKILKIKSYLSFK